MSGVTLEKALAAKLHAILGEVPWLRDWSVERNPAAAERAFDILAVLPLGGGNKAELWVECKSDPRPSQFPYVNIRNQFSAQRNRLSRVPVFAAPYISPNMARVCWEHGWSWFDLAGNYRLSVPGSLFLERTGQEPIHAAPKPTANLGTREAARVIRALLAPENAGHKWTQREMQAHCHVSLGLVNKVVRHLRDEAFIQELADGGFKLRDPLGMLTAWREAYRFDRHQRRNYFTLLQGLRLQQQLESLESVTGGHGVYAAFSAAEFQAPHVRQPKTWLFVGAEWEDEFGEAIEAKPVDSGENLVVLIPDDDGVFYLQEGEAGRLACTNPVQTYVDLWHCGSRGKEAAEALLEQNLKRAWKAEGLL
jgi:hypothetical protein